MLQNDPHWRDLVLFYEYYHGDNGAGIGASHQTGWSGTVGVLPLLFRGSEQLANRRAGSRLRAPAESLAARQQQEAAAQ